VVGGVGLVGGGGSGGSDGWNQRDVSGGRKGKQWVKGILWFLFGEVDAVGVEICGCRPWVGGLACGCGLEFARFGFG
jgi:hypothetical protein